MAWSVNEAAAGLTRLPQRAADVTAEWVRHSAGRVRPAGGHRVLLDAGKHSAATSKAGGAVVLVTRRGRLRPGRLDVLVQAEQVVRVVPILDRDQPPVGGRRVGRPDPVDGGLAGEVDVRRGRCQRSDGGPGPGPRGVEAF